LQSHAAITADGLVTPVLGQAQVVHRVPGFVQRAEQTREEVVGVESGGDADIPGNAFGERMLALVEPAAVEGKADLLHHLHDERPLLAGREFAAEWRGWAALLRC